MRAARVGDRHPAIPGEAKVLKSVKVLGSRCAIAAVALVGAVLLFFAFQALWQPDRALVGEGNTAQNGITATRMSDSEDAGGSPVLLLGAGEGGSRTEDAALDEPEARIAITEQEVTLAELSDDAAEYLDSSRLADVRRLGVSKATLQQMMSYLAERRKAFISFDSQPSKMKRYWARMREAEIREVKLRRCCEKLRKGMSEAEVVELLGEPSKRQGKSLYFSTLPDGRLWAGFEFFYVLILNSDEDGQLVGWYFSRAPRR